MPKSRAKKKATAPTPAPKATATTLRRPNRAHGACDKLPPEIQLQIRDWYVGRPDADVQRLTFNQISRRLEKLGHTISPSQIHRWISRQRNELERIETARDRAALLAKYLVPDGADVEQGTVSLLNALCLEALADAEPQQVTSIQDLAKVAQSVSRLQTSAVARDKWEVERGRKIHAAVEEVKKEVQDLLEGQPDLTRQLLDVIDRAKEQMLEKIA